MSRKGNRRKKNQERKQTKTAERIADRKDKEDILQKKEVPKNIRDARKKPLSVLGNKVLREEKNAREGSKSWADFVVKKEVDKGMRVPSNPAEIKKLVTSPAFRPVKEPPPSWYNQQNTGN